ncbi:hypothetical protein E2C11_17415 [Streptomyces lavendulae]|nr:hypothetical protein E2C11_17415 [Streptomyces lavendulae]
MRVPSLTHPGPWREAGGRVRAAVKTLTPLHRDALVLVYAPGTGVAHAARAPGTSPGTVRSRAFRTLHALRGELPDGAADLR